MQAESTGKDAFMRDMTKPDELTRKAVLAILSMTDEQCEEVLRQFNEWKEGRT